MTKRSLITILALFIALATFKAQRHEVGVQLGMANMVGDIGRTNYIFQKPFGDISTFGVPVHAGLIYRMNFNPYQTLRFNVGYSAIQFSDEYAKEDYRKKRRGVNGNHLAGTNSVYNLDAQFEYNFLPVNNEQKAMLSPYIFGGFGAILYSKPRVVLDFEKYVFTDVNGTITNMPQYPDDYVEPPKSKLSQNMAFSIPFGAGLKYKFNYNWALFGEFKFRYTFTDNIDYSGIEEKDVKVLYDKNAIGRKLKGEEISQIIAPYVEDRQIGNPNSNDWVNTVTLGISYSFGRPPCYCE